MVNEQAQELPCTYSLSSKAVTARQLKEVAHIHLCPLVGECFTCSNAFSSLTGSSRRRGLVLCPFTHSLGNQQRTLLWFTPLTGMRSLNHANLGTYELSRMEPGKIKYDSAKAPLYNGGDPCPALEIRRSLPCPGSLVEPFCMETY